MNRRLALIALAGAACACNRATQTPVASGPPEPWQPIDAKFKGCEGG